VAGGRRQGPDPAILQPGLRPHGEKLLFFEPGSTKLYIAAFTFSAQWAFSSYRISWYERIFPEGNPHDERINVPANPHHYWRYRMHLTWRN